MRCAGNAGDDLVHRDNAVSAHVGVDAVLRRGFALRDGYRRDHFLDLHQPIAVAVTRARLSHRGFAGVRRGSGSRSVAPRAAPARIEKCTRTPPQLSSDFSYVFLLYLRASSAGQAIGGIEMATTMALRRPSFTPSASARNPPPLSITPLHISVPKTSHRCGRRSALMGDCGSSSMICQPASWRICAGRCVIAAGRGGGGVERPGGGEPHGDRAWRRAPPDKRSYGLDLPPRHDGRESALQSVVAPGSRPTRFASRARGPGWARLTQTPPAA